VAFAPAVAFTLAVVFMLAVVSALVPLVVALAVQFKSH